MKTKLPVSFKVNIFPKNKIDLLIFLLILATAGVFGFLYREGERKNDELTHQLLELREQYLESTLEHSRALVSLGANLEETRSGQEVVISSLKNDIQTEKQKASIIQAELGKVSGSVTTLEKLTNTDKELLQKYSKVYFLNEHYIPARLSLIPAPYTFDVQVPKREFQIHTSVWPHMKAMMDAADAAIGEDILIASAYRSFGTQARLKSSYVVSYGANTANQFSADQGYSEHQLGTTVDFTVGNKGADIDSFESTQTFRWLTQNAHTYGFTLSYDKNNSYYQYEPWHWRFVGIKLATDLFTKGKHFYDLEQREIDAYLVSIFD
ncbi:MAG: hypothetical protein COU90_04245 [Candidatus Ryanbacteria bacterium CG10_big_fil_rev_8_21_14_0_10_43_42]|uniref:D-alanyl-D-alanine carboxypeptidase-like core domain-containing protein n=1 Tax=Candidatus Ryanbacteria bacterium CG10_big_fil_rev_8_21_14_0_10_43_42 TaxID=1974864 RepID=A0A2M8KW02_9BACT|nr:MAG: hypothetical protein COU90_04245 [Candidatus Ryanbacteria bacterium CG10_big_fil_rev_8_21_14_0_10_43_42]